MARWMVLTITTALALSGAWGVERPATWGKETACALAQGQGQAWKQVAGKGTVAAEGDALRIKGETLLLAVGLPALTDGEVEARLELLNDDGDIGLVFRADEAGAWQGVHNVDAARHLYHTSLWDLQGAGIKSRRLFDDGTALLRRPKGMDVTLKARFAGKAMTLWMDGDPIWSGEAKELAVRPGFVGVRTGPKAEVLLKALTVRPLPPPVAVVGGEAPRTVRLARDGLEVTLDARFPAILGYAFEGATLDGAPAPAFRASVNGVDYPATATLKGSPAADSAIYAVRVDMGGGREASFDVVFQVLPRATVAMRLERIDDTRCDPILTLNFPDQPLVSARARGPAATLSLSGRYGARHLRVGTDALPAEAATYAQIPILATGALAAALHNNVCNNRMEFTCRALPLPGGETCVGVWNTDFTWQGVDGKPLLPEGEPPTCRIVLTRDANADGAVDWQDGAIALRRLTDGTIPGADRVRRSMVHIGYNFVSEAQNPFLKVADNYRRMANLLDGFEQILLLKGYANEGHDSGHADYADINRRAGGAKDLNLLTDSLARERLGTFGVHINHAEAYPEAKMYDDTVISTKPGWRWMDQSYYIRTYVDIASGRLEKRVDDLFRLCPGIGFVYVDTYRADRYEATRLARAILRHGVLLGTEDAGKLDRWCAWTHQAGAYDPIHRFVYHTQKDVYAASPTHWGGYSRSLSMMGWQHGLSPMPLVKDFYTKQLPNKYLMHHPMRRVAPDGTVFFEGGLRAKDWRLWKDDRMLIGDGGCLIPWFAKDNPFKNPDDADKLYYWANDAKPRVWHLPAAWATRSAVKLYQNTQTGRRFVRDVPVKDGAISLAVSPNTPYVLYPDAPPETPTAWGAGSPIADPGFNGRDFVVWKPSGEATIAIDDDANGNAVLSFAGKPAGAVAQTLRGLRPGQRYRACVWAGAEGGKTARIRIETPNGKVVENAIAQVNLPCRNSDIIAFGKKMIRLWVDFTQPQGRTTARLTLAADPATSDAGRVAFMESRLVETADPGLPSAPGRTYFAYETFEYVEQGGLGIFVPENGADGGCHLSETHLPYTHDTIATGPDGKPSDFSLKLHGHGRAIVRTSPATVRIPPNTALTLEFDALGKGTVSLLSDANPADTPFKHAVQSGHARLTFTSGAAADYVLRFEGLDVLDNVQLYTLDGDK